MKNWDEKLVKHHYFQDFETKQLLQKFSANIFLVTPFNATNATNKLIETINVNNYLYLLEISLVTPV